MTRGLILVFDVAAILLLAFGVYRPRHDRPDVVVLLVGINAGAATVSWALADAEVSPGLGLALFGALAIIRLRSRELALQDVAYAFAALAMGLLAGLRLSPSWLGPVLSGSIIIVLAVVDHPRLMARGDTLTVRLDGLWFDVAAIRERLAERGADDVRTIELLRVDETDESTLVRVRLGSDPATASA